MARIVDVHARRVWDSRGRATVEAEIVLKGARGRAIAPAGASTGAGEAKALPADAAVRNVNGPIREALLGVDARFQDAVDAKLIALDGTPDKSRFGANAIVAVSLACLHASAAAAKRPLWRHLAGPRCACHCTCAATIPVAWRFSIA
jgi:enolase